MISQMGPILLQIRTPPLSRSIYCCKQLGSGLIIQLIKDTHKQQTDIFTNLSNAIINLEVSGSRQNPISFDFIVESNSCNNYTLDSIIKNKNIFYSLLLLLLLLLLIFFRKEGFILIEEEHYYNHQNPYILINILVFLKKVVYLQMSLLFGLMFSGIGCLCRICNLHLA